MELFRAVDHGTDYFFHFLAVTNEHLSLLFKLGYFASSWWAAALIALAVAAWLAKEGKYRTALTVLACFLLSDVLLEGVRFLVDRPPSDRSFRWGLWDARRQQHASYPSLALFLSTQAWVYLWLTARSLAPNPLVRLGIFLLGMAVVFGGFVCNLFLSQHYLSDLLAGLAGGIGAAFLSWSLVDEPAPRVESIPRAPQPARPSDTAIQARTTP